MATTTINYHAMRRARERYGVILDWTDMEAIRAQCKSAQDPLLAVEPHKKHEARLVTCGDVQLNVIYDPARDLVMTIAPWSGNRMFRLGARVRVTRSGRPVPDPLAALIAHVATTGGGHASA